MILHMMKSKIHRATITQADLNIDTGGRFDTYVIEGESGSGVICLNGAAAR